MPFFKRDLPNPGRVEDLKREAQSVLTPDVFDGARFEFNKTLTQKFALLHNISMGSVAAPSSYEFGANFGDDRILLASRIDMGGRLSGRVNAQLTDSMMLRLQSQLSPDGGNNSFKADLDFKGNSNTMTGYYMGGGLVGLHYMQSLTQSLALGGEGFYHLANAKVTAAAPHGSLPRRGLRSDSFLRLQRGVAARMPSKAANAHRRPVRPAYCPSERTASRVSGEWGRWRGSARVGPER